MKKIMFPAVLLACLAWAAPVHAWDGFDADTADLVEIIPDRLPPIGGSVDVRSYENDSTMSCVVESVTRNKRTTEVVVRTPDGLRRILVMEGR